MEDFPKNDTLKINSVTVGGGIPTIYFDPPAISGPLVEDDVDYNEIPPELPARSTHKMEPNSPEQKDSANKDLIHADSKHKPTIKIEPAHAHAMKSENSPPVRSPLALAVDFSDEKIPSLPSRRRLSQPTIMPFGKQANIKIEPAHAHAMKSKNSPPVRSPLALAVDFSDEKIPSLPARRRLSQPTIMPFGKQGAEPYVNTSVGRETVRPFTWKSAEAIGIDDKVDANAYEPVETEECVLSEAIGNVKSVSKGKTNERHIHSSENDEILCISPMTSAPFLITHNVHKDQNIKSANMERMKDLTINEIGDILRILKLDEYVEIFKENHVDGAILTSLERDDLVNELGMKKLPATRLFMYMSESHITK